MLVSVRRVELMQAWETMSRLKEEDATLEGIILATNRFDGGAYWFLMIVVALRKYTTTALMVRNNNWC